MPSPVRTALRETVPLAIPAMPFGLVLGVTIAESSVVPIWVGLLGAPVIFGGAAHITVVALLTAGAAALPAIASGLVVNARHLMYSAALASVFSKQPVWFRWLGPYVLIDQVFALATLRADEDPDWFRRYYLTSGAVMWGMWHVVVPTGVVLGAAVPAAWGLDFAVPVLFLALTVMSLVRRPAVVAAVVGFGVTVAASGLPNRTGLLVGALAGVGAAALAERMEEA